MIWIAGGVILALAVLGLMVKPIQDFLHLSSGISLYILLCIILFFLLSAVLRGTLQGLERFSRLSFLVSLEGAARFGFGVLFVLYDYFKNKTGYRWKEVIAGFALGIPNFFSISFKFILFEN